MFNSVRKALEADLTGLTAKDQLRGRDALVTSARNIADSIDLTYPNVSPQLYGQFIKVLDSLGIGKTLTDSPTEFNDLMKQLES